MAVISRLTKSAKNDITPLCPKIVPRPALRGGVKRGGGAFDAASLSCTLFVRGVHLSRQPRHGAPQARMVYGCLPCPKSGTQGEDGRNGR
ncbi:MAG: hypothetical protein PHE09_01085 [Oscillospiraceae bacterium]|nr:hypothetical protein [Oscillospiraceae bacterium]